jgi:hypothetical protein
VSKIIKKLLISYPKCIMARAGEPEELKGLKEWMGPKFGSYQTTPS